MEVEIPSELIRTLLAKRGVESAEDIAAFLAPDYLAHTHSPALIADMEKAVSRVFDAMDSKERIAIYADFDCDGIPGAAVLSDFFAKIGYENVEVYLPHRDREGYGFHQNAIKALSERDVKLIITVDVGTTALESVAYAKTLGVDVIVTDHHEIMHALPDAVAVLNPKRAPYPFPHLCGAAVAFKLAQAMIIEGKKRNIDAFLAIQTGWEKWLLDLVAIATIADMVPLVGENRALTFWGLQVLRKSPRMGIRALCTHLRLRQGELTEDDIGFSIGPRINAASRMDEPQLALRLLTTRDPMEAETLAAHLEELNASRKGVVGGIVKQAKKAVKERYSAEDRVVVLGNPDWKPALLGLAANSIMGDRGGIVCMWGRDANGKLKGSCRSDGVVSLVDLFANSGDVFDEYGGHSASGGFSVSHEKVHTLPEILKEAAGKQEAVKKTVRVPDAIIALREVSWPLYRDIARLAPFGMGNPKPVFRIVNAAFASMKKFGKESNHVEVVIACPESGMTARGFDFFRSPEHFSQMPEMGQPAYMFATLVRDTFRGPAKLALRIVDIVAE